MKKRVAGILILSLLVSSAAEAQWVFVARRAIGRIKQMQSDHADVATVILEAPAGRVYEKAVGTVQANKKLQILAKNDAGKTFGFTDGERKVKMQVAELGDTVSEILISASPVKDRKSTSSIVVERIMEICKEVKVECKPAS